MQDTALTKVADLLIEARRELEVEHPSTLRLCIDVALLEVGRRLASAEARAPDARPPEAGCRMQ